MIQIPSILTAGDTLAWTQSLSAYPASAGWTLKLALRGPSNIDLAATAEGDDHRIEIPAATTAAWSAGDYVWSAYVEKAGERHIVESGSVTIKPDPVALAAGADLRSHAKKVVDAIEALLEGRATKDQEEMSIDTGAGRQSLKRTPIPDLLALRDRYLAEVRREKQAERIAKGLGSGRTIRVRFR